MANLYYNRDTYYCSMLFSRRNKMAWTTPQANDMRFGFEITLYIANR